MRGQWSGVGVGVAAWLLAAVAQRLSWPHIAQMPSLFFLGAVTFAGWWGGWLPAGLTTVLSLVTLDGFFMDRVGASQGRSAEVLTLALFASLAVFVTALNLKLRRTTLERSALAEAERRARADVERERHRLESLVMQAPAHIALFQGPEHVYVYSNPMNNAFLGRNDAVGKPVREVAAPEDRDRVVAILDRVYQTGEPFLAHEIPGTYRTRDGVKKQVLFNLVFQPTRAPSGEVEGIAAFGFDVSLFVEARAEAEALADQLRTSEERYRTFVAQSGEGIWRIEADPPIPVSDPEDVQIAAMYGAGRIAECNDAMAKMYGAPSAESLVGARLDQFLVRSDVRNTEYLRAFIRSGYHLEEAESQELDAFGRPKIFLNSLQGVIEDGKLVRAWGIQRDVTEHRMAERARARLLGETQFHAEVSAVLSSSLDYEVTLATVAKLAVPAVSDWCLVDVLLPDGSFRRIEVAHPPEEAELAKQIRRFGLAPEGNVRHPPTQALLEGKTVLVEDVDLEQLRQVALSPEHADCMVAVSPRSYLAVPMVARGRTLGVLTFFVSSSGRRYSEERRPFFEELARRAAIFVDNARLYRELQDAVRLREEFLSVASHELRTPLTALNLKLQSLGREAERQDTGAFAEKVREGVAQGRRQVGKLSMLIGDLLDVSRIIGGRFTLEPGRVDAAALVREVAGRFDLQAAATGSALRVVAPEQLVGWWDALRLEQVMSNLIDNAIKYGRGKPVDVALETLGEQVRLTVKDQGIGIESAQRGRIFERFERAVSERNYGGLGLGLYITRTIVEGMGGTVSVESEVGQGATFTVMFPMKSEPARAST
jgi:signal transduction histidine kinase/PAS domain-containing protein